MQHRFNQEKDILETQYSEMFGDFMDAFNKEWMKLLRQIVAENDTVNNSRRNAFDMADFTKKVKDIKKKLPFSKIFRNIFTAMESVFNRVDTNVTKSIKQEFDKNEFKMPEMFLKTKPAALKESIETNIALIGGIVDKQSDLLEETVKQAVLGGSNFTLVQDEVFKQVKDQADKGKDYAVFVARDQVAKAYADINEERQKTAGFPGFIWICVNQPPTPQRRKGEVRPTHWELRNKYYAWNALPVINGKSVKPGSDYQCRCRAKGSFGIQ